MCPICGKFGRPEHKRLTLRVLLTCKMPWLFCYVGWCQRPAGCATASCETPRSTAVCRVGVRRRELRYLFARGFEFLRGTHVKRVL